MAVALVILVAPALEKKTPSRFSGFVKDKVSKVSEVDLPDR
jgi:hypothetical protein